MKNRSIEELRFFLSSQDRVERFLAIWELADRDDPRAFDLLVKATGDLSRTVSDDYFTYRVEHEADFEVTMEAKKALTRYFATSYIEDLKRRINDKNPLAVREAALRAVALIDDPRVIDLLETAAFDYMDNTGVRDVAISLLAQFNDSRIVNILIKAANGFDEEMRGAALKELPRHFDVCDIDVVKGVAADENDPRMRGLAMEALIKRTEPGAIDIILNASETVFAEINRNTDGWQRSETVAFYSKLDYYQRMHRIAIGLLAKIGDVRAIPALEAALTSCDRETANIAREALSVLQRKPQSGEG
jgi:HEAT repeat protein